MADIRHPDPESEFDWPEYPPGEPSAYVPRWLFELIDAKALLVYVWLGIHGVNHPPERRTPEALFVLMDGVLPLSEVREAFAALRAAGGLDAENRVQLYPPAGGE